jgi:hypothetical protein
MAETAADKEARYIASLKNPITSQNDPRIARNAGFNPEMADAGMTAQIPDPEKVSAQMTSRGQTPEQAAALAAAGGTTGTKKLVSTYTDPETGDIVDVYDDGTEIIRKKGTVKADAAAAAAATAAERLAERVSAYDILYSEFKDLGLESLVEEVKDSIIKSQSKSERILALRGSKAYQTRFGANDQRVKNGFKAIDEATYLALEDSYQSILQNYGMPEKYYKRGELGVQQYLADAISKNIDPVTFEEKIIEGQKIVNANKATIDAAKILYPELTDGDFLDYVINPKNAIEDIKRKVTAAEIGGAQLGAGLQVTAANAETLAKAGITGKQYQARATDIAEASLRGGQLASIYGEGPYTQQMAEQVQLDIPGSADSLKKTKKIAGLEKAAFGGGTGLTAGALSRDRAGAN